MRPLELCTKGVVKSTIKQSSSRGGLHNANFLTAMISVMLFSLRGLLCIVPHRPGAWTFPQASSRPSSSSSSSSSSRGPRASRQEGSSTLLGQTAQNLQEIQGGRKKRQHNTQGNLSDWTLTLQLLSNKKRAITYVNSPGVLHLFILQSLNTHPSTPKTINCHLSMHRDGNFMPNTSFS